MDDVVDDMTVVYFRYDGSWSVNDKGEYEWVGRNEERRSILLHNAPVNVTYNHLVEAICGEIMMEKELVVSKLSYLPLVFDEKRPVYVCNDNNVRCYLFDKIKGRRGLLYVEISLGNEYVEGDIVCKKNVGEMNDDCFNLGQLVPTKQSGVFEEAMVGCIELEEECDIVLVHNRERVDSSPTVEGDDDCTIVPLVTQNDNGEGLDLLCGTNGVDSDIPNKDAAGLEIVLVNDIACRLNCTFEDGLGFTLGHEFSSKEEAQKVVAKHANEACFKYVTLRSDRCLWEVRCQFAGLGCNWRLRVAKVSNSNSFTVRKHNHIHTCTPVSWDKDSQKGSSQLVASYLKENYAGKLDTPTPKELIHMVKRSHGVDVSYMKAYRGKKVAENVIRGDPVEHYRKIPSYLYMLREKNAGTVTHLELDEDGQSFKYLFIALGACIRGWSAMRKVIVVDATHLKGRTEGVLIVATAQDGNRHQYPIAWGVVDSENDKSWTWFMRKMKEVIPDGHEVVIISDRHQKHNQLCKRGLQDCSTQFLCMAYFAKH